MYSFSNLQPAHFSMSRFNCCFLTCIQVSQQAGKAVWYSHLVKNFPKFVVIHTIKGFSIVNEAEVDVFLGFTCFFYDQVDVGNLIFCSSAFSKSSFYIWKSHFTYCWSLVWRILSITLLECEMSAIVWTFFVFAFLWDWNENWPFPVLCPLLSFTNLLAYWV